MIYISKNMSQLHKEILTEAQIRLLPSIKDFKADFGLVGGTAIALHLGHRESIDFDLFPQMPGSAFQPSKLRRKFERGALIDKVIVEEESELTFITKSDVKVTFYDFEYVIPYTIPFEQWISIPELLTLAAMKGFALGHRAKWKDYVDLYFIMRGHHSLAEISHRADELFGQHFNEKLLRTQLSYFEDVRYTEPVIFKPGFAVPDEEIKKALTEFSLA